MSAALRYRRTLVVSRSIVERNGERIVAAASTAPLVVSTARSSNRRYLSGLSESLPSGFEIVDREHDNVAVHELLGSHPLAECAVSLESHVFGLRTIHEGDGVSYGAMYVAPSTRRIALAPIGFADGLDRRLTGLLRVRVDDYEVPVVGRIAMDSLSIDVTDVPGVRLGSTVTVYGGSVGGFGIADAARALDISMAEVISRLSERAEVVWR